MKNLEKIKTKELKTILMQAMKDNNRELISKIKKETLNRANSAKKAGHVIKSSKAGIHKAKLTYKEFLKKNS